MNGLVDNFISNNIYDIFLWYTTYNEGIWRSAAHTKPVVTEDAQTYYIPRSPARKEGRFSFQNNAHIWFNSNYWNGFLNDAYTPKKMTAFSHLSVSFFYN